MKVFVYYCLFFMLLVACAPVNVQTKVKKSADFASLKTYSWMETDHLAKSEVKVTNPAVAGLVREAVDKSLQKKGYVRKDGQDTDFLVAWFGAVEKKVKIETIDHFYRSSGYGTLAAAMPQKVEESARSTEYEEGTILIDVLDPKNHKAIWRGVGTDRLRKGMTESEVELYINRVVSQIIAQFPPGKK